MCLTENKNVIYPHFRAIQWKLDYFEWQIVTSSHLPSSYPSFWSVLWVMLMIVLIAMTPAVPLSHPVKAQHSHPSACVFTWDTTWLIGMICTTGNLICHFTLVRLFLAEQDYLCWGCFCVCCYVCCFLLVEMNQWEPLQITFDRAPSFAKKGHVYVWCSTLCVSTLVCFYIIPRR